MIRTDRRLWKLMLYSIFSFGIYTILFWVLFIKDTDTLNQTEKPMKKTIILAALAVVTIFIFHLIWVLGLEKFVPASGDLLDMIYSVYMYAFSFFGLCIYYWIWIFNMGDAVQTAGEELGIKVAPGGGGVLAWLLFGSFIIIGPLLCHYYLIRNMNQVAEAYNKKLSKKTKVVAND